MSDKTTKPRRWRWVLGGVIIFSVGFVIGGFALTVALMVRLFYVPCPAVFHMANAADYAPVSGPGVFPAHVLSSPTFFPPAGSIARVSGVVPVLVYIETGGHASQVHLLRSSGFCPFDIEALKDVPKWRFAPAMRLGAAVGSWFLVMVVFDHGRPPYVRSREPQRSGTNT